MRQLWEVADFVRTVRRRMRFGELSRAPLRLLRLELEGDTAECDWIVRPPDPWDSDLQQHTQDCNASSQALRDAMTVRDLLFGVLPDTRNAVLRSFRQYAREPSELVITGEICRETLSDFRVSSLAMRAKLCGFHFYLEDGILLPLHFGVEERSVEFERSRV